MVLTLIRERRNNDYNHLFETNFIAKSYLVKEPIKRRSVLAYFEVFLEYFGTVTAREQKLALELMNVQTNK